MPAHCDAVLRRHFWFWAASSYNSSANLNTAAQLLGMHLTSAVPLRSTPSCTSGRLRTSSSCRSQPATQASPCRCRRSSAGRLMVSQRCCSLLAFSTVSTSKHAAAVEISFDLSVLGSADSGEFGVALRSPTDSLSAALTMAFTASTPDASGTRMLHVRTSGSVLGPLPLLTVLQGEQLTIRALIDRASQTSDASCVRQLSRLTERVVAARPLHRGAQHSLFR